MNRAVGLIIVIILFSASTRAQKPVLLIDNEPGWKKIGETNVNFNKQDESIWIWGDDQFASIKLRVNDAALAIDRIQVFYESGEMQDFDVRNNIDKDSETCEFQLDPEKEVNKVAFTYQTSSNEKEEKATVVLYGLVPEENGQGNTSYKNDGNVSDTISKTFTQATSDLIHARHKTKVGPNGQIIYIEETPDRYYYVDRQGQKVYVSDSQLRKKTHN